MTCIVAVKDNHNRLWMGGDSAGVGGFGTYSVVTRTDPKVFKLGEYLIGFTSSFRMGQILRHKFKPPIPPADVDISHFMVTDFVDELRKCFKEAGWIEIKEGKESGGIFIVGIRGKLFTIEEDFQVAESADEFTATGCGIELALGSLHTSEGWGPVDRIQLALGAAQRFSGGVREPFLIISDQ